MIGAIYIGIQLYSDLSASPLKSTLPYFLLGIALLITLGFEFVNGFHDTANAVATVIYTHSMPPQVAAAYGGTGSVRPHHPPEASLPAGAATVDRFRDRNVIVKDGIVHLWGLVGSEGERKALTALAEKVSGVTRVVDEMIPAY